MRSMFVVSTLVTLGLSAVQVSARPGDWRRGDDERMRRGMVLELGEIRVGDYGRRLDMDVIDVANNPRIQCGLSHIRLKAGNDNVIISKIEVEYRNSDRYGRNTDTIDLEDGGWGRPNRGLRLEPNQQTDWLDLDDVEDGVVNGRCVTKIWIWAMDIPDHRGGRDGRGGWGRCRGPRCPPEVPPPARVWVDGFVRPMGPPHGGGGHGPGPGQPPHHRDRQLRFENIGLTDHFSKWNVGTEEFKVGVSRGRFDGIRLIARDGGIDVQSATVVFGDQSRVRVQNVKLSENNDIYFDFDNIEDHRRGQRDQDRFIDRIIINASSLDAWGSKGRLEVQGGR